MKYEDLTDWDLENIKSLAKNILLSENISMSGAMTKSVLSALHAMGYDLVKSETRQPTWTHGPKKSWYSQHGKKSW